MSPHEEEMHEEIRDLHLNYAKAERARLGWKFLAILSLLALAAVLAWHFSKS